MFCYIEFMLDYNAKVVKKFIYAKKPSHDSFFRYDKNRENLIISSSKIHQRAQEP